MDGEREPEDDALWAAFVGGIAVLLVGGAIEGAGCIRADGGNCPFWASL